MPAYTGSNKAYLQKPFYALSKIKSIHKVNEIKNKKNEKNFLTIMEVGFTKFLLSERYRSKGERLRPWQMELQQ